MGNSNEVAHRNTAENNEDNKNSQRDPHGCSILHVMEVAPRPASAPMSVRAIVLWLVVSAVVGALVLMVALLAMSRSRLQARNVQLEKDLVFYQSTDLAKELEISRLTLRDSEAQQAEAKQKLAAAESALLALRQELARIPSITNIISMMMATFAKQPPSCYSAADRENVDQALAALGDSAWSSLWSSFVSSTVSANCSFSPELLEKAVVYGLNRVSDMAKQ